ncbi:hypothetical protein EGW08_007171 [Elysia chlorotica]|uniref:Uncharacterized protein n=1 Tax=Elysia chlorotica TaxID=188477 RepID=A0A3S1C7J7_ELYCH|nr:hypothetical protein EGW08_007171 [Elysia chlorotica]
MYLFGCEGSLGVLSASADLPGATARFSPHSHPIPYRDNAVQYVVPETPLPHPDPPLCLAVTRDGPADVAPVACAWALDACIRNVAVPAVLLICPATYSGIHLLYSFVAFPFKFDFNGPFSDFVATSFRDEITATKFVTMIHVTRATFYGRHTSATRPLYLQRRGNYDWPIRWISEHEKNTYGAEMEPSILYQYADDKTAMCELKVAVCLPVTSRYIAFTWLAEEQQSVTRQKSLLWLLWLIPNLSLSQQIELVHCTLHKVL